MKTAQITRIPAHAALLLAVIFVSAPGFGVEPVVPSSVDIYWKSTRSIVAQGVTSVIVLDEEIAHAQLGNDTIEFVGLSRGETVALAYVNGAPVSIVVRVIEHPLKAIPPSLLRRESELAHAVFGSDFQTSSAGGNSSFVAVDSVAWSQQVGDNRLDVNSLVENNTQFGGHNVNLRTAGVAYSSPRMAVNVVDFNESLTGAIAEDRINNFSSPSIMEMRGVGVTLYRGKDQYSFFGGSTLPYYFLSLNATRDIAGFSFHRKQSNRVSLFGGTTYASIPTSLTDGIHRRNYVMQSAGASYRIGKNLLLGGQAGISNAGGMVRADASYSSFRLSAYGSAIFASQTFPLNQLQSLFSGSSSLKGGFTYRTTFRLSQGFYFEHSTVSPGLIYRVRGSSDYLSPTFSYNISRGEAMNFAYIYSRNTGGFSGGTTTGNRYDMSLNSQLAPRVSNTAQVTIGSLQDPLGISSQDTFSVHDSISIPIKGQTLLFGVEHDRVQPSLIAKLNSELNLLSPQLQGEFLANPAAFIESTNFPPEIKALLAAQQPTGTSFSASGTIAIGSKLRISPNTSFTYAANGASSNTWTQAFGYSASYQLRPGFQFRSSLNNVFLWDAHQNSAVRSMVLSVGFQKSFATTPGTLPLLHRTRTVEGRVFRDNNINGIYNVGEPGLEGIEVRLDDGQVATTDAQGRYRFRTVSADQHQVSIDLTQFKNPVRMTTRSEAEADLIQQHTVAVNFGVLDFARVMGNVYNDLRFENHRQPDSKGMQGLELVLDNGKNTRKMETSAAGDFELDNVPPGDYALSFDSASIPANYVAPTEPIAIHVSPVSTVVQDLPMRALRSISGRLLLKVTSTQKSVAVSAVQEKRSRRKSNTDAPLPTVEADEQSTLNPVAGVQIIAGPATSITDKDGNFLLRNLPAGDLTVTIRPVKAVPDGLKIPTGAVRLPAEPVQIQGATIVITNAALLPYLTQEFPVLPGERQQQKVAAEVLPKEMVREAAAVKSAIPPAKPVQTYTQPVAVPVTSHTPALPVVPEIVIPVHVLPGVSVLQVPEVSPNPPVVALIASTALPKPAPRSAGDTSSARNICENVTSLADAARCVKQKKQSATMGTLQ